MQWCYLGRFALSVLILVADIGGAEAVAQQQQPAASGAAPAVAPLGPFQVVRWAGSKLEAVIPRAWSTLRGPVGTACITGDDRVGKSTLLTLWARSLLGEQSSSLEFSSGHTHNSHTRGLWAATLPAEATGLPYHLSLCDSQGLKQVGELEGWRLFTANVLMPSVLVYMLIDVVQNDQLRDLASFAEQFKKLPGGVLGEFGKVLAPHLIIVVREASLFASSGRSDNNITAHLEDALSGPTYAEQKALIKSVFRTREAWLLREMPRDARVALFERNDMRPAEGTDWQQSGLKVLKRVQAELDKRRPVLPHAHELPSWLEAVVDTVNSDEAIAKFVRHGERTFLGRQYRWLLEEWSAAVLLVLSIVAMFFYISGAMVWWIDRVAWLGWIVLWNLYVGTSTYVTTPLQGIVPRHCDSLVGSPDALVGMICREASGQTAALLLATLMGMVSYPVLSLQFRRVLMYLPLPTGVQRLGGVSALACVLLALRRSNEGAWDFAQGGGDSTEKAVAWSLVVRLIFGLSGGHDLLMLMSERRAEAARHEECERHCLSLHNHVQERIPEVQTLQASSAWRSHFRRLGKYGSSWQLRKRQARHRSTFCFQAAVLFLWALLLSPHVDFVLAAGAALNVARCGFLLAAWLWEFLRAGWFGHSAENGAEAAVNSWWSALEDTSDDSEAEDADAGDQIDGPIEYIEETDEDVATRNFIERMRRDQELRLRRFA
eukprot:TRINITY_DN33732_c0_g1_i1.p1 TRINITY_DN33732_c0_g1~~TRINITY_DN33732_c0_g1_i1.p1  ORF type:complete len:717 (-),score=162.93 TRINITY_DN33732_c0_g1_i1:460-2610(-)